MKKILMLGGRSWGVVELLKAAKSLGVYTIVTDYNESNPGKQIADESWTLSTRDLDALEKKCREENVDAVFCGINEPNMDVALELCNRLQLPCYYDQKAWDFSRNKANFKSLCEATGTSVPKRFYVNDSLDTDDLKNIKYPVVVKVIDLCGSMGMSFCYDEKQLIEGYEFARSTSKKYSQSGSQNPEILIEEMIVGKEYTTYYALAGGEIRLLCITEIMPCPGLKGHANFLFETSLTDNYKLIIDKFNPCIEKTLKAAGCRDGVAWVEFMMDENQNFYVLEFGHRLSGTMVELTLPNLIGFDSYRWVVECQLGISHSVDDLPSSISSFSGKCGFSYILKSTKMVDRIHVIGLDEIVKIPGVTCSTLFANDEEAAEFAYSGNCGVVTITAKDCEEMCRKIEKINQTICFMTPEGEDVFRRFNDFDYLRNTYARALLT